MSMDNPFVIDQCGCTDRDHFVNNVNLSYQIWHLRGSGFTNWSLRAVIFFCQLFSEKSFTIYNFRSHLCS